MAISIVVDEKKEEARYLSNNKKKRLLVDSENISTIQGTTMLDDD